MNKIELIKGDCLEKMKDIPNKSIDMILCDLPYGTTNCKWDTIIPFEPLWKEYERIIKDNGAIVLTSSEPFTSFLITSNIKLFKYDLIWHKTHPKGHLNAKKMPMRAHENICVFYRKPPTYNPQKTTGHNRKVAKTNYVKENDGNSVYGKEVRVTDYDSTERYPLSIQTISNGNQNNKIHPTEKPMELMEYLIKTYTNENELVLDNTFGSCSTGIACMNTNRNFTGIELDDKYFELSVNRIKNNLKDSYELIIR